MIICGDIALSKKGAVKIEGLPDALKQKIWFGNLEGTLVDVHDANRPYLLAHRGVFNDYYAIKELTGELNFCGFGIANNHIHNYGNPERTINYLHRMGKLHAGAGKNVLDASEPAVVEDNNGVDYTILACASQLTGSKVAKKDGEGVNPWVKTHVKKLVVQHMGGGKSYSICTLELRDELSSVPLRQTISA